jgi:hypothetical protein
MRLLALLILMAAGLSNEEPPMGIAGVFGIVLGIGVVALFGVLYALCRDVDYTITKSRMHGTMRGCLRCLIEYSEASAPAWTELAG